MRRSLPVLLALLGALATAGAQERDGVPFLEYQLQGELVGQPRWVNGTGFLMASDDRSLILIHPERQERRVWPLPRLPKGPAQSGVGGLGGVQLGDGRLAVVHLRGGLVSLHTAPLPGSGTWLMAADGRLYWLGKHELAACSPAGERIGSVAHGQDLALVAETTPAGYRVVLADGSSGWILLDGSFQPAEAQSEAPRPWSITVRPEGYRIESDLGQRRFVYEAEGGFGYQAFDAPSGWLVWSDSRWKLFLVHLGPRELPPRPQAPPLSSSEKAVDRRFVEFRLNSGSGDLRPLVAEFRERAGRLEDLDWLAGLAFDLLLEGHAGTRPQVLQPQNRQALLDFYRLIARPADARHLAAVMAREPERLHEYLDIAEIFPIDPEGHLASAIERSVRIRLPASRMARRLLADLLAWLPSQSDEVRARVMGTIAILRRL